MILVTRNVDELGRIVLPTGMRQRAGIECGTPLDITQDETGAIHIGPAKEHCKLCGLRENIHQLDVGVVCDTCMKKIKSMQ